MAGLFQTTPEELRRMLDRQTAAGTGASADPFGSPIRPAGTVVSHATVDPADDGAIPEPRNDSGDTLLAQAKIAPDASGAPAANEQAGTATTYRTISGDATYYNLPGKTTASGEPFDASRLAAAMTKDRLQSFGTEVIVRLTNNPERAIRVRINDRGPFERGPDNKALIPYRPDPKTIIDLTPEAFKQLTGDTKFGRAKVEVLIPDKN